MPWPVFLWDLSAISCQAFVSNGCGFVATRHTVASTETVVSSLNECAYMTSLEFSPIRVFATKLLALSAVVCGIQLVAGCGISDRLPPVSLAMAPDINPLGVPLARFYAEGDEAKIALLVKDLADKEKRSKGARATATRAPNQFLAISGGGDDGAYGAGVLVGWTARGDRPQFKVVTGISTGALSAPFAFLGPDYDTQLRQVYTDTTVDRIFTKRSLLAAVADDAMTDTAPLGDLIGKFVDTRLIARIAQEYENGRLLLIATTNLDQGRAVIWNIGAIAQSKDPRARELIILILRASAAIPGAFPPVMMDVTVDGQRFEEMHVDGGAVAQSFLYPSSIKLKRAPTARAIGGTDRAFIIRNGRQFRPEETIKRQTLAIAGQAISTMTAASGINDTYRIYLTTKRDGVDFNLTFIGDDFAIPYKGPFDRDYMRALFAHGFEKGKRGGFWLKVPPGYIE